MFPTSSLVIRADATTAMGTGHVMRCIALAQAWQDHGGKVTFLSHCESKIIREIVSRVGLADVRAFGMTWENCEDFLSRLGYRVRVEVLETAATD